MKKTKMTLKGQRFKVGCKVVAFVSGWTGVIVRKANKNRSSPWIVRWDKNGMESNVNAMVVEIIED